MFLPLNQYKLYCYHNILNDVRWRSPNILTLETNTFSRKLLLPAVGMAVSRCGLGVGKNVMR